MKEHYVLERKIKLKCQYIELLLSDVEETIEIIRTVLDEIKVLDAEKTQ
jgi:hypothetical protein